CCFIVPSASVPPWRCRARRTRASPRHVTWRGDLPPGRRPAVPSSPLRSDRQGGHTSGVGAPPKRPAVRISKMTSATTLTGAQYLQEPEDFSLVHGGPLFQLLLRTRLTSDDLTLVARRINALVLITWVPLLLLAGLNGQVLHGNVAVPFLRDVETHIRFLVVVPLLLAAELVVHQRLLGVVRAFLERNLIPNAALPRFDAAVTSAFRLRNSLPAELMLLALVYVIGVFIVWRHYTSLNASTWYASASDAGLDLSRAGIWYAYVSLPIFQFLLLRWYFRVFIWIRFLWQVSRIDLALVATHPDQLGGLGFLANTVFAFSVLLVAHGAMLAAQIANRILFVRATLPHFNLDITPIPVFLLS